MRFELTDSQLLAGVFVLTLGLIFAIAALAQIRIKKAQQFRNYFCSDYEPISVPNGSWSKPEEILADQHTRLPDFDARYTDSGERQARTYEATHLKRE
jgi:hypothetical protein